MSHHDDHVRPLSTPSRLSQPTRGLALHHRRQGGASKPDQAPRAEKKLMKYHAHRPEAVHHIADEKSVARGGPLAMRQSFGREIEIVGAVPARRARRGGAEGTETIGILVIKEKSAAMKGKSIAARALSSRKAAQESAVSAHSVNEYF